MLAWLYCHCCLFCSLSGNAIGDDGVEHLAQALSVNRTLESIRWVHKWSDKEGTCANSHIAGNMQSTWVCVPPGTMHWNMQTWWCHRRTNHFNQLGVLICSHTETFCASLCPQFWCVTLLQGFIRWLGRGRSSKNSCILEWLTSECRV